MHVVFHVVAVWGAVDLVLIALWASLAGRRRREDVADMVRAAERHANSAEQDRPLSRAG
jgi:hypothetical protein